MAEVRPTRTREREQRLLLELVGRRGRLEPLVVCLARRHAARALAHALGVGIDPVRAERPGLLPEPLPSAEAERLLLPTKATPEPGASSSR